jgi:hemoglobin
MAGDFPDRCGPVRLNRKMHEQSHGVIGMASEIHKSQEIQSKRCIIYTSIQAACGWEGNIFAMPPVTETEIAELVDNFYGKIRTDPFLGPIFASAIGEDWGPHLEKMRAFWSSVMLGARTYKGNPMIAHMSLPRLTRGHFDRWLALWRQTTAQICDESTALLFVRKAEMIAERLLYGVSAYHDSLAASADGEHALQTG